MIGRGRLVAVVGVALAIVGAVVLPVTGAAPGNVAEAADTSQFRAGNIITDQLFFDGSAMSAGAVQTFLNVRNPNCVAGAMPCLKNYRQTTPTRAGSSTCPGTYTGAANETAATIIAKIGQACGISQRVLLVILQKEEGLVTASGGSLSTTRYRSAMGFGCPDTAACDSTYYGFFNQVYAAASQYRRYAAYPTNYSHRAGMTNNVRYNPSASCGSSPVYIANQATAGLYNYTPYQPNAAALAAGAGTGDYCSAYGNRNFWIYFTNWFGSTQTAGAGDLVDLYVSSGAENGPLGAVTEGVTCGLLNGGCKQGYANGSIYWSPTTGAHSMVGAIGAKFESAAAEQGPLGYPKTSVAWLPDHVGQYATFQGGTIYWSPATGPRTMMGEIGTLYASANAEHGPLGYPTQSVSWLPDHVGQYATFQNGAIYWSPTTGARTMMGAIGTLYASANAEHGPLGYPTQSVSWLPDHVGQYATFQGGTIYWSPATGAHTMMGEIGTKFAAAGAEQGALGYPTQSVSWLPDHVGQYADFQNGTIYWSPTTGARAFPNGAIATSYAAADAEHGPLGYPTSDAQPTADGQGQYATFQNGAMYWSPDTDVHTMSGPIGTLYASANAEHGPLKYPTSDVTATADGQGQYATFQGGAIYWTADTGARSMQGAIGTLYSSTNAEQGPLGYPTTSVSWLPDHVGQYATFQHGTIYWSPTTGARMVPDGPIGTLYSSARAERGPLKYPTSDVTTAADGQGQYATFQGGAIYWSPDTGAHSTQGAIGTLYASANAEHGPLGYPKTSVAWLPDHVGQYATFQGGTIYWSPKTGARTMMGAIGTLYASANAERGPLGYPTSSVSWLPDHVGQYATFQGGTIYWSPTTGAHTMMGAIGTLYASANAERGPLGYPKTSVAWLPDHVGQYATFEGGTIYWSPKTGARTMMGAIGTVYAAAGAERGVLGYPTQSVSWLADHVGQYARFQGGTIYWSPSTGARIVKGVILTAWTGVGAEHGTLGYPTGDASAVTGGSRQNFQRGYISVATATGRATVHVN